MKRPKFQIGDEVRKVAEGGGGRVFRVAGIGPRKPLDGEERRYSLQLDTTSHIRPFRDVLQKEIELADAA